MNERHKEELIEWTRRFIQSRNALLSDVNSQKEGVDGFDIVVETKTKTQNYLIIPDLTDLPEALDSLGSKGAYLVTLNTKRNLDNTSSHWDELIQHNQLCLIFVNPDSRSDQKWAIYPATHAMLTETKKLRAGLLSLSSTVEEYKK